MDATSLQNVIEWEKEVVTEPIFTSPLTREELECLKEAPLELPRFSIHTQSCERTVKRVTEAACTVAGEDERDGFIRAKMNHQQKIKMKPKKRDFINIKL